MTNPSLETILQVPNLMAEQILLETDEYLSISSSSVGPARDLHSPELYAALYYPAYSDSVKIVGDEPLEDRKYMRCVYLECTFDGKPYVGVMLVASALSQVSQRMIEFKNTYLAEKTHPDSLKQLIIWFQAVNYPFFITYDGVAYTHEGLMQMPEGVSFRVNLAKEITSDVDMAESFSMDEMARRRKEAAMPIKSALYMSREYTYEDRDASESVIQNYILEKNITQTIEEIKAVDRQKNTAIILLGVFSGFALLSLITALVVDKEIYSLAGYGLTLVFIILLGSRALKLLSLKQDKLDLQEQFSEYSERLNVLTGNIPHNAAPELRPASSRVA